MAQHTNGPPVRVPAARLFHLPYHYLARSLRYACLPAFISQQPVFPSDYAHNKGQKSC